MTRKSKAGIEFLPALLFAFVLCPASPAQAQTATEVVLYDFSGAKGSQPSSGVISDSAGNLYGTANYGGTAGFGVVYKLETTGRYMVLHSFTGGTDGASPTGGVALDSAGNVYGTTLHGGPTHVGVVYKVDPAAGQEAVLHSFTGGTDGGLPSGSLIVDPAGNIYGTASSGGAITGSCPAAGCGVVFKVDATGQFSVLHRFAGTDGASPNGGVIADPAGNLYGTTYQGGANGGGVVYQVDPAGQLTVLYNFTGQADGSQPLAGVIHDSDGSLYGTTSGGGSKYDGTVFSLDAAGQEKILHSFFGGADGRQPVAGVVQDPAGNLYGTTPRAGTDGCGVVYKLDTAHNYTVLYSFKCGADGRQPDAGVIRDAAGNLYGTTIEGGKYGFGVIFKVRR
jgi:uncharacterized repeat protein (TIGR03803 family)